MTDTSASTTADRNFIIHLAPDLAMTRRLSSALSFQPRLVGAILLLAMFSQSPRVFTVLATLLWWCALLPNLNPFDFVYNHTLGRRPGAPQLGPAPMPRRFAQGMAGTFAAASAASIAAGFTITAWVLQAMFLLAVAAQVFTRFCLGSFTYHLLRGRIAFAMDTLPWRRGA
jgi:hypothetical protein